MDQGDLQTRRPAWPRLGMLWLLGIDLRLTILAVPPVLPLIHRDLHKPCSCLCEFALDSRRILRIVAHAVCSFTSCASA